jgi:hypothetical protein
MIVRRESVASPWAVTGAIKLRLGIRGRGMGRIAARARRRGTSRGLSGPAQGPKSLPIRLGKRLAFHRFQRDFLREQNIADNEVALRSEAPLDNCSAGRIMLLMNVHCRAKPNAVARAGV